MAEKTLIAKVREDGEVPETLLVTSPVVGMADGAPELGAFLNPFGRVITMKILNERYVLRLPRDVHGRVIEAFIPNSYTPVAYGESIARVDPRVLQGTGPGWGPHPARRSTWAWSRSGRRRTGSSTGARLPIRRPMWRSALRWRREPCWVSWKS